MAPIRAITLDLDDTLWPIWPVIEAAEQETMNWFAEHAPKIAEAHSIDSMRQVRDAIIAERHDIAHNMGALRLAVFEKVVQEHRYPASLAQEAYDVFYEIRCQVTPYEEVQGVLTGWSKNYRIAALTNGNADLQRTSLNQLLQESIRAGDAGYAKPDLRLFHLACDRLGASPEETLHIGDHPAEDIEGARAAGMQCIWMNRSGMDWPLKTAPPRMAADLLEVDRMLTG